jgi:F-type H+-transporting ATPase subunit epsilon
MSGFTLHLCGAESYEQVDGVAVFVGADASGSFGILPGHEPLVTTLRFGLARFRLDTGPWRHLAVPGAVLRYADGELHIATRRYLVDDDPARIGAALQEVLLAEEAALADVRDGLKRMEEAMLKRLWELERQGERVA